MAKQGECFPFQSTLPARGATPIPRTAVLYILISIHAPRTGSDSICQPHVIRLLPFQSTLPARGATERLCRPHAGNQHFNPRSPHGERPTVSVTTHESTYFNPRSPHGERRVRDAPTRAVVISIHAPRTGSDRCRMAGWHTQPDFNPRSPHGERRTANISPPASCRFQSTLPARGATRTSPPDESRPRFQSTLPARGATPTAPARQRHAPYFNPRSPHGERPNWRWCAAGSWRFQSTLPARGAT